MNFVHQFLGTLLGKGANVLSCCSTRHAILVVDTLVWSTSIHGFITCLHVLKGFLGFTPVMARHYDRGACGVNIVSPVKLCCTNLTTDRFKNTTEGCLRI